MVMDIALYIKQYGKQMDWGYIWDEADKIELDAFIKKLLYICSRWFHTDVNSSKRGHMLRTNGG